MSKSNRNQKKNKNTIPTSFILLFMTLFCIGTIYISLIFNISGGPLHSLAGFVFVPMEQGINAAGNFLGHMGGNIRTLRSVQAENAELKAKLEEVTQELDTLKLDTYDLQQYKDLLNIDSKFYHKEYVAASVVAKEGQNWFTTFTVDKGTLRGVKPGMNVMIGNDLVGIVTSAGPNFSTVRTIISDDSRVSGMVLSTGDNIIVNGSLESMTEDRVIGFSILNDSSDGVKIGDPVVTSFISDVYHQGILIGYIDSITNDPNNLTKSGTIVPACDFEHLTNVLILLEEKKTGEDVPEVIE